MAHLELIPKTDVSSFRKLAIGSWKTAYDPTVYGTLTVRMDKALAYIEAFRQRTGVRLTVTHLVPRPWREALRRCPDANAVLRFNRIYLRQRITVSALVAQTDGGKVDWYPAGSRTRTRRVCVNCRRSWRRRCARCRERARRGDWRRARVPSRRFPTASSTSSPGWCRSSCTR